MKSQSIKYFLFTTLVSLFAIGGCATTYNFERNRPDAMAEYLAKPAEKALATFRISGDNFGYGYGENYNTIEEAKKRAMDECRSRQREYDDVEEPCKIYMVNNEKVAEKESGSGNEGN